MSDSGRQPTFIHIDSQFVEPQDRVSRISRQSQASAQTWNYTSQQPAREPPPIVIPDVPADPAAPYVPGGFGDLDDEEYMTIDPDGPDLETAGRSNVLSPTSSKLSFGKKGFVGGFVSSLRKFPKAIRVGRKSRKPTRRGTDDTGETGGSGELGDAVPPRYHTIDESGPSNVQYVEAISMPEPELAPPASRHPSPPGTVAGSLAPASRAHSRPVSASHHDHDPPDTTIANQQDGFSTGADVHANTEIVDSPVLVEPLRSSGFARMNSRTHDVSERSFSSQTFPFNRFLKDLKDLPWISTRVTTDYIPGTNRRAGKSIKTSSSWYKGPHHESLDLLSSGTSSSSPLSPYSHRSRRERDSQSHSYPFMHPPNRRSTRHYRTRTGSHDSRRELYSDGYNYPMYPFPYPAYGYSPQPLFVMQPPGGRSDSPRDRPEDGQHQATGFPDIRQAVPVYMVSPTLSPLGSEARDRGKHPHIHPFPLSMPGHPQPTS